MEWLKIVGVVMIAVIWLGGSAWMSAEALLGDYSRPHSTCTTILLFLGGFVGGTTFLATIIFLGAR